LIAKIRIIFHKAMKKVEKFFVGMKTLQNLCVSALSLDTRKQNASLKSEKERETKKNPPCTPLIRKRAELKKKHRKLSLLQSKKIGSD